MSTTMTIFNLLHAVLRCAMMGANQIHRFICESISIPIQRNWSSLESEFGICADMARHAIRHHSIRRSWTLRQLQHGHAQQHDELNKSLRRCQSFSIVLHERVRFKAGSMHSIQIRPNAFETSQWWPFIRTTHKLTIIIQWPTQFRLHILSMRIHCAFHFSVLTAMAETILAWMFECGTLRWMQHLATQTNWEIDIIEQ